MRIISTYSGHESNISFYDNGKITVVELDKLMGEKYFSMQATSTVEKAEILERAMDVAGIENDFDMWVNGSYHGKRNGILDYLKLENIINTKRMVYGPGHHTCHAHSAYWQSPFDKAYLISSDGGGNDGYFNIYYCDKVHGPTPTEQIDRFDFGTFYAIIAGMLPQVGKSSTWLFDTPGKAMALAGQLDGVASEELKAAMHQIYSGSQNAWEALGKITGLNMHETYNFLIKVKNEKLNKKILSTNYSKILTIMSPIIPHLMFECLETLNLNGFQQWPEVDKKFLENKISIVKISNLPIIIVEANIHLALSFIVL